jgi:phage regulator Rha-like protein
MFNKIKVAKKLEGKHKEIVKGIENLFNKYGESITIKVSNFDQQTEKEMQV